MDAMKLVGEKAREAFLVLGNKGGEALAWFNGVLPPETRHEKFKRLRLAVDSSGAAGLAWLAKVYPPPESRAERFHDWLDVSKPYLTAAAALTAVYILYRFCCGGGGGGPAKMMKAPGRNYRMARAGFESNPKGYFRDLHAGKNK